MAKQTRKKTKRPRWDQIEIEFLKLHYPSMSNEELSKHLGRSPKAILVRAQSLHLHKSTDFRRETGRRNISLRAGYSPYVGPVVFA